ncbi:uncharacterized protein PITG_04381 [Phytophthora infestans T30-4]|uniref:Temptin Cys/Cys disulfide domain-containing protein n=2 Tax=Phytophthora infestans TaxID=4787 RepID=D0N151_PHYIT|nr:uncharacterized protein PITG_04381 [Phytophthora infestans T30-4]EEY67364.1 conserved hypothetical protein [Phytophthora infestans T30-4]KAF4045546.1 hypothetical protein GN244_ATG01994 [Phytophthora infestans]KAF4144386.1 hypothetical protein GN958_ATG06396 [Phytophthora infestans]KAI9985225.1 hypothetical protein PInf_004550 [Phytophthora infestans]|eukprot:XP_002906012.1 conserved hypothetical protein [Phytophthora infestans T30-4]
MVRLVVIVLSVALTVTPSTVQGYAKYVKLVPNGGNVPDNSNIGHLDPAGETGLSKFGEAFSTAGNAWAAALCQEDTDGDGFTNGQELGDPCCTWTSGTAGLVTDGVSDPSDASKTPTSSELKAGCSSGGTSTSANFTGSGDSVGDVVGTVSPAGPTTGGLPPDDDEDDSSESAVLTAGASMTTINSVVMGLATAVALAVVL